MLDPALPREHQELYELSALRYAQRTLPPWRYKDHKSLAVILASATPHPSLEGIVSVAAVYAPSATSPWPWGRVFAPHSYQNLRSKLRNFLAYKLYIDYDMKNGT